MRRSLAVILAAFVFSFDVFADGGEKVRPETEIWNEGVKLYLANDVTNALPILKSLILSKRYGARAAEVVAKIEYENNQREEALEAAAIALRSRPTDERTNRNFTRALDGIAAIRREKRISDAVEAAKNTPGDRLLKDAQTTARRLLDESVTFLDKPADEAVRIGDELSHDAEKLSLVWPPVRAQLLQAVTNEEEVSTMIVKIDEAEKSTMEASRLFSDLNKDSYATIAGVEEDISSLLKVFALPPLAIEEDFICQSNAYMNAKKINDRSWQSEALDFTRTFRAKFPAWARAYEQQAQADTNKPPFTAENQAAISDLAHRLEKIQLECVDSPLPPEMQKALEIIEKIRELMPKDNNSGSQGQKPNPDNKNQNDKSKGDNNSEPNENDQPPQKEQENAEEKESPEENQVRPEVESILKKAQERTDEHEEEKKARMRKQKLPPNERDW